MNVPYIIIKKNHKIRLYKYKMNNRNSMNYIFTEIA